MHRSKSKCGMKLIAGLLAVFGSIGVGYAVWSAPKTTIEKETDITTTTERVVCYNKQTSVKYTDLKVAMDNAASGQEVIMFIGATATCTETLIIKQNTTLTIPFIGKTYNGLASGGNVSETKTLYEIESVDERDSYGKTLGDSNLANVKKFRSALINMRSGADIDIYGVLNIGGAASFDGNNGYYSEINLGLGSSITCRSGSVLRDYGYIKENIDDANPSNGDGRNPGMDNYAGIIDNSMDEFRFLSVESGSTLYTNLAFYDLRSAGGLTGLLAANRSPFNVFDLPSIQTYCTISAGASVRGIAIAIGPSGLSVRKELSVISQNNAEASLLYLTSGKVSIEYKGKSQFTSKSTDINGFNIVVDGELQVGYLYFKEGIGTMSMEMDTRMFHLPFSSKASIYVTENGRFNIAQKVKFLMGSKLFVEEGGEVYINNSVAFYNSKVAPALDTSAGIFYNSSNKEDALLENNGTIIVNQDSSNKAYFGAFITHSNQSGNAKLDFTRVLDVSYLTATVGEGTAGLNVIVPTSGNFYLGEDMIEAQFSSGNDYTSCYDEGKYYWNGEIVTTVDIPVTVVSGVLNPVLSYSILLSENENGSGSYYSELKDKKDGGIATGPIGSYFKLEAKDAAAVVIKKNGAVISNVSSWLRIDLGYEIQITPTEGVEIYLNCFKDTGYEGNESQWSQGLGHTIFYVKESDTQSGTYTETFRQQCSSFTHYVKKGKYFKVGYTWDQADLVISFSGMNGFRQNNTIETNKNEFKPQPATSWDNSSTSSESDPFLAGNSSTSAGLKYTFLLSYYSGGQKIGGGGGGGGGECYTGDTEIMMADGSIKLAKDIHQYDVVKTFDHNTGRISCSPVAYVYYAGEHETNRLTVNFASGRVLKIVDHGHCVFDYDAKEYINLTPHDIDEYIGRRVYCLNSFGLPEIDVIESYKLERCVEASYSIITAYDINCFANGLLNVSDDIEGLYNYFELDENMKVDEAKKQRDIELYGLATYEEWSDYCTEEEFEVFNCQYLNIAIGKGLTTRESLIERMLRFTGKSA